MKKILCWIFGHIHFDKEKDNDFTYFCLRCEEGWSEHNG